MRLLKPILGRVAPPFANTWHRIVVLLVFGGLLTGGTLVNAGDTQDWLIDPKPFVAKCVQSPHGDRLYLRNGLVERTIALQPNAATVGLKSLSSGQSILRSVTPEARVQVDGVTWNVGGLIGVTNRAFLLPSDLERLRSDPEALQYRGHTVGKIRERMPWKHVRHHAPDAVWPPAGVELRLEFAAPSESPASKSSSDLGRVLLWSDQFAALNADWSIVRSDGDDLGSFQTDGIAGSISAPAGTAIYAEHALPENAHLIEADIQPGTDRDSSWGPGLGLVWPDRIVEVNLRPGDRGQWGHFELRDRGRSQLVSLANFRSEDGGLDVAKRYRLRARLEASNIHWEVADAAASQSEFIPLFVVPLESELPRAARLGKTDREGGAKRAENAARDGAIGQSRIFGVRAFGPFDSSLTNLEATETFRVSVHYEIYDGLPVIGKWIEVHNLSDRPLQLNAYASDLLAAVEHTSEVDALSIGATPPNLHIETEMAFGGMTSQGANRRSYRWIADPDYHTQVNYEKQTPCLLEVGPDLGPEQTIAPKSTWQSYRSWMLLQDSTDRERSGLAVRRMLRVIAPWVTENPLMMHLVASEESAVKQAIDQCHEVGFEMLILSFGSGFNLENRDPAVMRKAQMFAQYAHEKGIEIGSYSLLASRSVNAEQDVVSPEGVKPVFGNSPCLESQWGAEYFQRLRDFHTESGFDLLEHDGSYPGDACASLRHPGHHGLEDSRWNQWEEIAEFYRWCRGRGMYLNVPDHYFLAGSNKTGMGYRETNWSLPRAHQVIHTRQNIYDGTWQKTPSMGWMFVPLTQYHGGGPAATIEPLDANLDHYRRMLQSNLALGVQACYRGPRLYDTPRTRDMVREQVAWFKQHRDILESDVIHGRRADGQSLDWMLHVGPGLREKGLLAIFNPSPEPQTEVLDIPMYYTGLVGAISVIDARGARTETSLDYRKHLQLPVTVPGESFVYFIFE
ncbi:MAG: hypothetical protein ACK5OB_18440 [Pirellula sp.]